MLFSELLISSGLVNNLIVPSNFEVSIIAKNLDSPRQIAETTNGHIIIGSKKLSSVSVFKSLGEKLLWLL